MKIEFTFDPMKAIQAVAFILQHSPGQVCDKLKLWKLLYIANRRSLAITGVPVLGGPAFAMVHGPVVGEVHAMERGWHDEARLWDQYLSSTPDNKDIIRQIGKPGSGKLSDFEKDLLAGICEEFKDHGVWDVVELTHVFPEWEDPWNNRRADADAAPIRYEDILKTLGVSKERIEAIRKRQEQRSYLANLLGN